MTALARPDGIAALTLVPEPGSVGGTQAQGKGFWAQVVVDGECWIWTGLLDKDGYGKFWTGQRYEIAHRFAYVSAVGLLHPGWHLDHTCRRRACIRPDHLEEVTPYENNRRSNSPSAFNAVKTHCLRGHPLSGENLRLDKGKSDKPARVCRECERFRKRRSL